jgi:hypothetical protein
MRVHRVSELERHYHWFVYLVQCYICLQGLAKEEGWPDRARGLVLSQVLKWAQPQFNNFMYQSVLLCILQFPVVF